MKKWSMQKKVDCIGWIAVALGVGFILLVLWGAAEAQAVDPDSITEGQKEYDFCIMNETYHNAGATIKCVNSAATKYIEEHGQEKYQEVGVREVGILCFHSGAKVVLALVENCKSHLEE